MELLSFKRVPKKHKLKAVDIKAVNPGNELIFTLASPQGKLFKPVVKVGEEVKVCQIIAVCQDEGSNIYSTVSGKVLQLKEVFNSEGKKVPALVIENDQNYIKNQELFKVERDYQGFIKSLLNYSLVDTAGNSLYEIYKKNDVKSVEGIIINATKWDINSLIIPYLLKERATEIMEAVNIIKSIFVNASIFFVFNKEHRQNCVSLDPLKESSKLIFIDKAYKNNMHKYIIKDVMGNVSEDKIIVDELQSLINIFTAIVKQEPVLEEVISITDSNMNTCNYKVRIGTKVSQLYEAALIESGKVHKITKNGIISGQALLNDQIPVTQGTESLAFLTQENLEPTKPCIRCGQCAKVCPAGLYPSNLINYLDGDKKEEFIKFKGIECVSCGLCSYLCPSRINLCNKITLAKENIVNNLDY